LVVWEWQSETYAMKQQGHFNNMTCLDYSSDGQYIATGGEDGKVHFNFSFFKYYYLLIRVL
jgi:periodic tryptophan protein 2